MTATILQTTTKILLRWSEKPFNGKPASRPRIILRHGESGRTGKRPGIFTRHADGAANLNAGVVAPRLACHVDDRKHSDSISNQQTLAFGVRLIC